MKKLRNILLYAIFAISIIFSFSVYAEKINTSTPDYYETEIRKLFKEEKWAEGKGILDKGLEKFPSVSGLYELAGLYYYNL